MAVKMENYNMNTEYFENDTTKVLSDICRKSGCPNYDVKIRLDDLTFFDPSNEGNWLTYHYDGNKWILGTRSLNPWNKKILDGLNKCFKDGIEGLMPMMDFNEKIEIFRR